MLFCGAILSFGLIYATAHAPTDVSLAYDTDSEELTVNISHPVSDNTHYIISVEITINSVLNATHGYADQPSNDFVLVYPLLLVPGDTVSVTATCVIGGSMTETLTIPGGTTTDDTSTDDTTTDDTSTDDPSENGDSIPGYTAVATFLSLLTLGILFRHTSRLRRR